MDFTTTKKASVLEIVLKGCLDATTSPNLENEITCNLDGITELKLDFKDLEYISSAGLRILLSAQKLMEEKDGKMEIFHVCANINEIFAMTGFDEVLTIVD